MVRTGSVGVVRLWGPRGPQEIVRAEGGARVGCPSASTDETTDVRRARGASTPARAADTRTSGTDVRAWLAPICVQSVWSCDGLHDAASWWLSHIATARKSLESSREDTAPGNSTSAASGTPRARRIPLDFQNMDLRLGAPRRPCQKVLSANSHASRRNSPYTYGPPEVRRWHRFCATAWGTYIGIACRRTPLLSQHY